MIYYLRYVDGELFGFKYQENTYFYDKNFYGDIIAILDINGEIVANYEYDSWGKILSIKDKFGNPITDENNPAIINPFRYREYYYDQESGMYNICKRYYDPELKRFINTDSQISDDFIGNNLYAYCGNNPIDSVDEEGKWLRRVAGAVAGAALGVYGVVKNSKDGKVDVGKAALAGFKGAIFGALSPRATAAKVLTVVASNLIDNVIDEVDHQRDKNIPKEEKRTIAQSIVNVAGNTIVDSVIDYTMGEVIDDFIFIPNPIIKKAKTAFLGKRAFRVYYSELWKYSAENIKNITTSIISMLNSSIAESEETKQREIYKIEPQEKIDRNNVPMIPCPMI